MRTEIEFPLPLANWCRAVLGNFTILANHSQPHSESQIWQLIANDQRLYLKVHHRPAKWGMEVHAYEQWVPAAFGYQAPQLIAASESPLWAILLTELAGMPMDRCTLSTEQEQEAWQAAGVTLAQLHALPPGQWFGLPWRDGSSKEEFQETDPEEMMYISLEYGLARANNMGLLSPEESTTMHQALEWTDAFAGDRPTPCHGDYQPRNWLVSTDGIWRGVIDFEHARWDLRMNDLGYWWDQGFHNRPDLEAAFLQGYKRPLDDRDYAQLYVIRALSGLRRIMWGHQHHDEATEQLGRCVLNHLLE